MKTIDGKLSFEPDLNARLSKAINKLIDEALEVEAAAQEPRDYLGGSRLGVECLRALGYEHYDAQMTRAQITALRALEGGADDADAFLQRRLAPFKGKTLRRFRMGHIHEAETVRWLRAAGFNLRTHAKTGRQFGWSVEYEAGKLGGSIDGVILDGPALPELVYPTLFEHKIMRASKWNEFVKHGAVKSHPVYVAQCQVYMRKMELEGAILCAVNTDTSEIWCEIITLDAAEADRILERGVQVLNAPKPETLPRVYGATPEDIRCRWCAWHKQCWSAPAVATPPAQSARPSWV